MWAAVAFSEFSAEPQAEERERENLAFLAPTCRAVRQNPCEETERLGIKNKRGSGAGGKYRGQGISFYNSPVPFSRASVCGGKQMGVGPILGQTHLTCVEVLSETKVLLVKRGEVQGLRLRNLDLLVAFLQCAKEVYRCSTYHGFTCQ